MFVHLPARGMELGDAECHPVLALFRHHAASDRYVKSSVDQLTNPIAAVPRTEFAAACQKPVHTQYLKAAAALTQSVQASNAR